MHLLRPISVLLATVFITSCSLPREGKTESNAGNEHGHEAGRQLTLFSDSIEFFIEFPQLVSGEQSHFTIHLTRLDTYKPVGSGSVSVRLEDPAGEITASSSDPIREGIFEVAVSPGQSGFTNIHFSLTAGDVSGKAGDVSGKAVAKDIRVYASDSEIQAHEEDPGNEITFLKENAWNSDFKVSLIEPGSFSGIIKTGGEILAIPGAKHHVHARSAGMVHFSRESLVAGAGVAEGEQLVTLKGEGLAHENIDFHYAEAKTRFQNSRSDYERKTSLLAEHAVSEKEFIESRTNYLIDSFYYYNVARSYGEGGLVIRSPIEGHIHELAVSEGEYIRAGQLIATVSSDKKLLLKADVPQQYFEKVQHVVSTNFRPSYSPVVMDIADMEGKLLAIGATVAENHHYLPVYFEALNRGDLLEGAFAEFYLKTGVVENALTVPATAVLEERGMYFVYVQTDGEHYLKRAITIADSDGLTFRVEKGLSYGERVVTRGSMLLKTASISTAIPVHAH